MRIIIAILLVLLIALQIQVWQERSRLQALDERLSEQVEANVALKNRNDALFAEVQDLRVGLEAIEERARAELGLVGEGESFYLIVDPDVVGELPLTEPAVVEPAPSQDLSPIQPTESPVTDDQPTAEPSP